MYICDSGYLEHMSGSAAHKLFCTFGYTDDGSNTTDSFTVKWYYYAGGEKDALLNFSTTTLNYSDRGGDGKWTCEATAPDNARYVQAIITPVSTKSGDVYLWTGYPWTCDYVFDDVLVPPTPSVPTVTISGNTVTASVKYQQSDPGVFNKAAKIRFAFFTYPGYTSLGSIDGNIDWGSYVAKVNKTIADGSAVVVQARALAGYNDDYSTKAWWNSYHNIAVSEWTAYSDVVYAKPSTPTISSIINKTTSSVQLTWGAISTATSYSIEYAQESRYFDTNTSAVKTTTSTATTAEIDLGSSESGVVWYFRIRAYNEDQSIYSNYSNIVSIAVGEVPDAPTVWSDKSVAMVGDTIRLYWVHNATDGGLEKQTQIWLNINGTASTVTLDWSDTEETTHYYDIDTSSYSADTVIQWKVKTRGVMTSGGSSSDGYSDWSATNQINIYSQPSLNMVLQQGSTSVDTELTGFPLNVVLSALPDSQTILGYTISIIADASYTTTDEFGNTKAVLAGQSVYSEYVNTSAHSYTHSITPSDVTLANNNTYTVQAVASYGSGLLASASADFTFKISLGDYMPNMQYTVNTDKLSITMLPFVKDADGYIDNMLISVYRREFDGSLTEISKDNDNASAITVTDLHPALNYARYRLIATDSTTGAMYFHDFPVIPVNFKSIVIQWDESSNDYTVDDSLRYDAENSHQMMLILPYDIEVSEETDLDATLVSYVGRENPVSYYGTMKNQKGSWSTDVIKKDTETILSLRKLAVYRGDVYVREPSGVGYWANIKVSFGHSYDTQKVPVSISVKRVEGGA